MPGCDGGMMFRIGALAALVVGLWLVSGYGQSRPDVLGADAPAAQFSAVRADLALGRILAGQPPHPAGSAAAQGMRDRILEELAALGVEARTLTAMSCYATGHYLPCGTVTNIIADVSPGQEGSSGRAVVLMAHSDSVAAGPGAADDGSGVAILLETIRALKARGAPGRNPVVALFTDGEEAGLLGAAAFVHDPASRAQIGAVINVEARGNQGPSYLFQTSAGNGKLIDLYAQSLNHYATSSLYGEIYKYLPNDTDLTPMMSLGVPAYNFAFIGDFAQYHTPLDRRENIDPRSLQQQGEAVTALADALARADLAQLAGRDAVYLDVLGRWLPRLGAVWTLPLSAAVFMAIALAGFWTPRPRRVQSRPWLAAIMPPLMVAGCAALGFGLHALAAWTAGHADPSFAHPLYLRLALGLGVFAVALVAARGAGAIATWLWFAGLAVACALWAPGVAPYFLFPACVAAPLLLVTVRGGRGIALGVCALAALVVWMGLCQGGEAIMGLTMHPLFTVSAAFALLPFLSLLKKAQDWRLPAAASLGLSLVLAAVAGFQPAFSAQAPERLNLRYAEMDGKALWLADAVAHLPDGLRAAAPFSPQPQSVPGMGHFFVAAAGQARLAAPRADVQRKGDNVTMSLQAPGDGFSLFVPQEAHLTGVGIGGLVTPADGGAVTIACVTPDCAHARLTLILKAGTVPPLQLLSYRRGLPAEGGKLLAARPSTAVPSQDGDRTIVAAKIAIPAR